MKKIALALIALATISPAQAADNLEDMRRESREVQRLIRQFERDLAVHAAEIAALKSVLLQLRLQLQTPTEAPMCEIENP
jgi:hypothetical protein